jgi:type III secretion protein V
LSIGAGLVAQIPSLLVAVASGLLVTRVASAGDRALGDDLGAQLAGSPRVLGGAAILLVGLALVPGLPIAPFIVLGVLAGGGALLAAAARPQVATLDEAGADSVRGPRLALRLPASWRGEIAELHRMLAEVRADVTRRTGIPIPPLSIVRDGELAAHEVALAIDGTPVSWLPLDELRDRLVQLAPELIGIDRTAALVERAAASAPVLVREVVPRLVSLPVLTEVLRQLAREQVPLDDVPAILEAIALAPVPQGGFTVQGVPALVEHLRGQLRRQISARWAPRGQLAVYTVDAMIEDAVRSAIDRREGAQVLALEPAIAQDIVAAVRGTLGSGPAVILTSGDVRRHLRTLLEPELPDIAILAAHELAPGTAVTTAGRIDVA